MLHPVLFYQLNAGFADMAFHKICIVGLGLIGSSLVHALRKNGVCGDVWGYDNSADICARAKAINLMPNITEDLEQAVSGADFIVMCVPVGVVGEVACSLMPYCKSGAVLSDVSSVKGAVITAVTPHLRDDIHFIPAHPIAGTENSGPEAGFPELFKDRWCIITPVDESSVCKDALNNLKAMWQACGSDVETMTPSHHDRILAITSHLPHLIAYTIVGTATDLADDIKSEVIKYSASGFRDFTRIAASDPTMWRDIFLNNQDAVLDVIQRFSEDLSGLQKAIRRGNGDALFEFFTKTRDIRKAVIEAKQEE